MKTRTLGAITACWLSLSACGGGSDPASEPPPPSTPTITALTADAPSYFLGQQARITATFTGGTGVLEPDGVAITSGQPVTTPMLSQPIRYRLVVTNGTSTATRTLDLAVSYRDRLRAVPMSFARGAHRAVALPDGRVLIIGGEDDTNLFPASVPAFDPVTETFQPFAQLSSGRTGFVAIRLYSSDVLVAGGTRSIQTAPDAEVIDHVTGAVTPTLNAPQRRHFAAGSLLMDGKVFISGGLAGVGISDTAEVYDPETRMFTVLPGRLQVGRYHHTSTRIDQRRLLIYGGIAINGQAAPPEIYDVLAGTSTVLAAPEVGARANHASITLQDGGILLVGGEDYDQQPLATVLRFDPASSTFSLYATLAQPRTAMAINRLVDGRLLVAGGVTGLLAADLTATTELISDTAQRRDGPAMAVPRRDHTVTRLDSGKLLIVGGLRADAWPLASAEIYE